MPITIPRGRIETRYARSGGPGGQHVNKTETKAEIRFVVAAADWLPAAVRARLQAQQASRITKEGELIITSERSRSRADNLEDCFDKLAKMLATASVPPKRRRKTKPSRGAKARRLDAKKKQANKKRDRSWRPD